MSFKKRVNKKSNKRRNNSQPLIINTEETKDKNLELEVQIEYLKHIIKGLKRDNKK